jgi:hypothetical protein
MISGRKVASSPLSLPNKWARRHATDRRGLPNRLKISFESHWIVSSSTHADKLPTKYFLKTSPNNQQMFLGKWEDPDFEG